MQFKETDLAYFSATGTTKTVARAIGRSLAVWSNDYDFLMRPQEKDVSIPADHLLVAAMPVYNGRIPEYGAKCLRHMKGNGTPAIAAAVYGNREYDDALLEIKNMLEEQGFFVVGAGAFIARHSIFPQVATDRPDAADLEIIKNFALQCKEKLAGIASAADAKPLDVRGNFPYRPIKGVPMKPTSGPECDLCAACAVICPTGAITPKPAAMETDESLCISCGACIEVCPIGTRRYRGEDYEKFKGKFVGRFSARREPELFI